MNKKEISVLCGLIITVILSVCGGSISAANTVRENTLRLHIIANSDSKADQEIKLKVRDEILQMYDLLPINAADFDGANKTVTANLTRLESRINNSLESKNIPYNAVCSVERFNFDTTQYTDFVLPKGEYAALTVRLGNAQGKNWWCVVYPNLCSGVCGQAALEESDDYIKSKNITPRFKIAELYEDIKARLCENNLPEYDKI